MPLESCTLAQLYLISVISQPEAAMQLESKPHIVLKTQRPELISELVRYIFSPQLNNGGNCPYPAVAGPR